MWYCHYARGSRNFTRIRRCTNEGVNVEICGYDAPGEGRRPRSPDELYELYLHGGAPFGHELVLACLLLDVRPLPWERYMADRPELYDGLFSRHLIGKFSNGKFPNAAPTARGDREFRKTWLVPLPAQPPEL